MLCYKCKSEMRMSIETYHYTGSGLDNVYLEDVEVYRCPCGECLVSIKNAAEIQKQIGLAVINKQGPLSGKDIRFLRKNMRLKASDFIKYIGVDKSTFSRWENQGQKLSKSNDRFIRVLYATFHDVQQNEIKNLLEIVGSKFTNNNTSEDIRINIEETSLPIPIEGGVELDLTDLDESHGFKNIAHDGVTTVTTESDAWGNWNNATSDIENTIEEQKIANAA